MATTPGDLTSLVKSINSDMWQIVGISGAFGLLGGLAHKFGAPAEDKTTSLAYLILGAVSGIGVLFVVQPEDGLKLIGLAVVAGYAGKAVLSALQARVEAAVAKNEAAQATSTAKQAIDAGKEAVGHAKQMAGSIDEEGEKLKATLAEHLDAPTQKRLSALPGAEKNLFRNIIDVASPAHGPALADHQLMQELDQIQGRLEGLEKSLNG